MQGIESALRIHMRQVQYSSSSWRDTHKGSWLGKSKSLPFILRKSILNSKGLVRSWLEGYRKIHGLYANYSQRFPARAVFATHTDEGTQMHIDLV